MNRACVPRRNSDLSARQRRGARGRSLSGAAAVGAAALALALSQAPPAGAAGTIVVNTTADSLPVPSECSGAANDCSLRQALDRAVSGDTVVLPASASPYMVVNEKIALPGGITIRGAGDQATTIDGNGADQAFELVGGGPSVIIGLTITNTLNDSGKDEAGAINGEPDTEDPLTLEDVAISDSSSPGGLLGGFGGAIETGGALTIRDSRFEGDSVTFSGPGKSGGGAIDVFGGASLTISDSVFVEDTTVKGGGGAIALENKGSLAVTSSTFIADAAGSGHAGGAIDLYPATRGQITNSTFTANAAGSGGAIYSEGESLSLLNDTIAGNAAEVGANLTGPAKGSGVTVENTIIATPSPAGAANCSGLVASSGHNLEDTAPSTCGLSAGSSDVVGASPALQSLGINSSTDPTAGGAPPTLALSPSSPALSAGDPGGCAAAGGVDERGFPRPGVLGGRCDIGAYELLPALGTALTVNASALQLTVGSPLTLTASVALNPSRSLPGAVPAVGGGVEFSDGGIVLGTGSVDASGHATLTLAGLEVGAHTILASYGGDVLHRGSSSAPVEVTVAPPLPSLGGLGQSHSRWREGGRRASLARRGHRPRPPVGTTYAFALNTAAKVTLTFTHGAAGRLVHKHCVTPRRRNRHAHACRLKLVAGTLVFSGHAGVDRVAFQGRISSRVKLAPGRYTVTIAASDSAGRSAEHALTFTILTG